MNELLAKLRTVAHAINRDKGKLHFMALVHPADHPQERWDLLVSADRLAPWAMASIEYVVKQLKREMTAEQRIKISAIVSLPKDNPLVTSLAQNGNSSADAIRNLHPRDEFDEYVIIWPNGREKKANSIRRAPVRA